MACMEYLEEELDDWLADQLQAPRLLPAHESFFLSWAVVTCGVMFPGLVGCAPSPLGRRRKMSSAILQWEAPR